MKRYLVFFISTAKVFPYCYNGDPYIKRDTDSYKSGSAEEANTVKHSTSAAVWSEIQHSRMPSRRACKSLATLALRSIGITYVQDGMKDWQRKWGPTITVLFLFR